jgi:glycerol-3-phosphate dehydrogenase
VLYDDGQFDDARLLISLAQTAAAHGACLLNYVQVVRTIRGADGLIRGVRVRDIETGGEADVHGRCVINATGAFCDQLRQGDAPDARPIVQPSQGAHVVLDQSFLPGETAITIPRTRDGRVLFAIPWHGRLLVGTTETPVAHASLEPRPLAEEVDFLLDALGQYLTRRPTRGDVLSTFAGIRPLVASRNGASNGSTAHLSREHVLEVSQSGLVTVVGGKWTTYRAMAQACIDLAAAVARLPRRLCVTQNVQICGTGEASHQHVPIDEACVRRAARDEAARTVDDVLSRRTRALQLDARDAVRMAPEVARLLAEELGRDPAWQHEQVAQFQALAANYILPRS